MSARHVKVADLVIWNPSATCYFCRWPVAKSAPTQIWTISEDVQVCCPTCSKVHGIGPPQVNPDTEQ